MKKIKCLMVGFSVVVLIGGNIVKAEADEKVTMPSKVWRKSIKTPPKKQL